MKPGLLSQVDLIVQKFIALLMSARGETIGLTNSRQRKVPVQTNRKFQ